MFYYKANIQYDGSSYAGFQFQNELSTVQSDFNNSIAKIYPGKFSTTAASRTDSGVHALEQIVKITTESEIELTSFIEKLNTTLSAQIHCISIEPCSGDFHPSALATGKEYRYFFTNKTTVSDVERKFIANISNKLNIEVIKTCLSSLMGKHDFCNFQSAGSNVKSSTREIYICQLNEVNPHDIFRNHKLFFIPEDIQNCYELRIEANGFLKQMIRHIVSSLWMVGTGKISVEQFNALIDGPKSEKQWWKVAPPNGLFLYKIHYKHII